MKTLEIFKLFENFIILNFFEILWNFWKFWNVMKILKFLKKNWNFKKFLKFWNFRKKDWTNYFFRFYNFEIFWKFSNFMKFSSILISKKLFLCDKKNILHSRATQFHSLILHESAIWLFIAQKLLFANQYVSKWNVTCIASGQ
jgi:hypothetical protein